MIEKAKDLAMFFLREEGCIDTVTPNQIDDVIRRTLKVYSEADENELRNHIIYFYKIWVDDFKIIEKEEARKPWLKNKASDINWAFWNRYKIYLEEKKKFPPKVVNKIDQLTDRTLDALFDPAQDVQIDKRGMVVGEVQSGKTANYTGLICKAVDAGFNFIIILAGIHNNLRSQTQIRIDEGFLGFDTQHQRAFKQNNSWIGVGENKSTRHIIAHSLTSSLNNGDFNKGAANSLGLNFNTREPIIAVVKKNVSVLKRLVEWLSLQTTDIGDDRQLILNKSLLIIDDEADHASINTKKEDLKPTRINGQIRSLLRLFSKSSYVGYTATPFANIFIPLNDDNLFPRDFIINIEAPSNYIGAEKIFGFTPLDEDENLLSTLPIVCRIDDYDSFVPNGHKNFDPLPTEVPESLKLAIRCFIITCAIRRLRGQENEHNSMLIHVSRFQRWQNHIYNLVENVFNYYKFGINHNLESIIEEIRKTFEEEDYNYKPYTTISNQIINNASNEIDPNIKVHSWDDLKPLLNAAVMKIQVKEIHGGAKDILDYQSYDQKFLGKNVEAGLSVIAIGGNKLSRGLTLEGLSVSYYLRASKMYDTLMQMGRWFGYRPGYVDLCRLFTSRELNEWYCHIALASQELRDEFEYMSNVAGSTPEKYALKVRTHKGVLQISATNKIRKAKTVNVSWAGSLVETYKLSTVNKDVENNKLLLTELINNLDETYEKNGEHYIWKKQKPEKVLPFISNFASPFNPASDPIFIAKYIKEKVKIGELNSWTIAIMSKKGEGEKQYYRDKIYIKPFKRIREPNSEEKDIYYVRKSHIISPKHESIDLEKEDKERAMKKTEELREKTGKEGKPSYPNGNIVRNEIRTPQNPLLLIYTLEPEEKETSVQWPVVGFAISFPGSNLNDNTSFAIHEDLLNLFDCSEDDEFEDYDDED
jgi:hypothetical protein